MMDQVEKGIRKAVSQLEVQYEHAQANIANEVFMSDKFNQIRDSFHQTLDEKKRESEE